MSRSNNHLKNLLLFVFAAAISVVSAAELPAQCEGTYFKTTGRTVVDSQSYIYPFEISSKAADLTGDGKIDLVATNVNSANDATKLFIFPGNGAGGFGAKITVDLPGALYRDYTYFIKDFNRDGKNDLIVQFAAGFGSSNVLVYLNNGMGAFSPLTPTAIGSEDVRSLVDVNNDGRLDLTTLINGLGYRLANADGTFGARVQLPSAGYRGSDSDYGDFDGDGDVDFAGVTWSGFTTNLVIAFNGGNGTFTASNPLVSLDGNDYDVPTVADFNNDNRPDVLFLGGGIGTRKIAILINQGNNNFTKTIYNLDPGVNTVLPNLGDFNGDGFKDFILPKSLGGKGYVIGQNNGAGAFSLRYYPFGLLLGFETAPVGDFNGDGKTDILLVNNTARTTGGSMPNVFNETQFTVKTAVCNNFGQTRIIDFDGDRVTNRTLWRAADGRWRYQYESNIELINRTVFWGASNDLPVPGDYDGDGFTDQAVFRSNGFWHIRNSSNNSMTSVAFGLGTDKPVPADYDGDGRTDIAVFRPSDGNWYFILSRSNQFSATHFGVAEDLPLPEDYDGDERTDIAVFRPSQGNWYILRSSDNSFSAVHWGLGTDEPHPADYDGDGQADIAVRRKSNNTWYFLRSSNNQFAAVRFGISEDIVQNGDYDGNGIIDLGVYRPSTRIWYSSVLRNIFGGRQFGEAGEVPAASILR